MSEGKTKPNVLLVCTDHWPGRLLNFAGHPSIITPTLDSLAAAGIHYPKAYSECPVCVPARRTLMTGLSPRGHGMRDNSVGMTMPKVPTIAQSFRDNGYQAFAVGKLHVSPQRDRIGFDEVILDEEGRVNPADDYEIYLGDRGFPGQRFAGGMSNNEYAWRPWHLPEDCHVTNWATTQMCRTIKRRNPAKPAFFYLSYSHPHPPLSPLQSYLDMYRDVPVPEPHYGDWSGENERPQLSEKELRAVTAIRRAFYALCTHIDHQLRVVIGTLRQEGILDNTIILFTADHGDMLGNHGRWAKRVFFEDSANVPMILSPPPSLPEIPIGRTDERVVGWADVMPTLLDMCGLEVPFHCEGVIMTDSEKRDYLFGECVSLDSPEATRMIRRGDDKLIYYPHGNRRLLFNLREDPQEKCDLSGEVAHRTTLDELTALLIAELRHQDGDCLDGDMLRGFPSPRSEEEGGSNYYRRTLSAQRGLGWP